jgi:hypothetical protein
MLSESSMARSLKRHRLLSGCRMMKPTAEGDQDPLINPEEGIHRYNISHLTPLLGCA